MNQHGTTRNLPKGYKNTDSFFTDFIHLFMRDTEYRQREKQAPCREPDAGLDSGSPGPCLRPKAGAKPLSHPGIPPPRNF